MANFFIECAKNFWFLLSSGDAIGHSKAKIPDNSIFYQIIDLSVVRGVNWIVSYLGGQSCH